MILVSSHFGYPLSSTHVISGGVMGAGAAKRLSAVRWGVAGNIVVRVDADAAGGRPCSAPCAYWLANALRQPVLLGPAADQRPRARRLLVRDARDTAADR